MVSRLMLNIQNPSLFGNFSAQGWGGNSETSTLGTFFAAERSSGRRGECTSIRFLGRDIQDDESSLGDPAWHRETQAAIQGPEETESSGACGCGVQPVFSHNLLLCCRCRTSTDFLMIIRWSSMSWVEAIILRQSKISMAWTSNLCSVSVGLLMLQYHVTSLMCLRPQNLRRFCSQTYYYRSLLLPMQVHKNNQGHLHWKIPLMQHVTSWLEFKSLHQPSCGIHLFTGIHLILIGQLTNVLYLSADGNQDLPRFSTAIDVSTTSTSCPYFQRAVMSIYWESVLKLSISYI